MADTYAARFADATTAHKIGLLRAYPSIEREFLEALAPGQEKLARQLLRRIPIELPARSAVKTRRKEIARVNRAINDLRALNRRYYREAYEKSLSKGMARVAEFEAGWTKRTLDRILPKSVANYFLPLTDAQQAATLSRIRYNGKTALSHIDHLADARFRTIEGRLREMVANGSFTRADELFGLTRHYGLSKQAEQQARALARTLAASSVSATREAFWRKNKMLVKGVIWQAVLDDRTTALCRSLHGNVYPIDDGPRPPAHVFCRSTVGPVFRSWSDLTAKLRRSPRSKGRPKLTPEQQAAFSGAPPKLRTYDQFLRASDAATVERALGTERAAIYFANPSLKVDRFVDGLGRQIPLKDLALQAGIRLREG